MFRLPNTSYRTCENNINDLSLAVAELRLILKSHLEDAQSVMKEDADAHRHAKTPVFEVGDKVYLSTHNIQTKRPSKKLDYKRVGPFDILEKINSLVYKLDLPSTMKLHPNFHVSQLERVTKDLVFKRVQPQPKPVITADDPKAEEWEVEDIVDSRLSGKKKALQYRVKWKGFSTNTTPGPAPI